MSLDILKERFSGKPINSHFEEEIENKEKIIHELKEKTIILSDDVNKLKNEKNLLIQKLNEANRFEDGVFSTKKKEYENKLESKNRLIKEIKQETDLLYQELDKKDKKLSYKDSVINNSLTTIKEAKNNINYLNGKLKSSKDSKKELQLEIKKTYEDYIFKIDTFETDIKDKNDIINEQKQILERDNKKLKNLTDKINNLTLESKKDKIKIDELSYELKESKTSLVLENNVFKQRLNEKEKNISQLKTKVENLSEKVTVLSETAREKSILEKKLQEAEEFQSIVKNNKNNYQPVVQKKSQDLNTDGLIYKLKEISKQKQGPKPLSWKQWIEIPESNYLNELNHYIAKKIFNENNRLFLSEDKRNQYDSHAHRPAMAYGQPLIEELRQNNLLKLFSAQISNDIDDPYFNVVSASHDGSSVVVTNIVSDGGIKEYQNNVFTLTGHSGSFSEYGTVTNARYTPEPKIDEDGVRYLLHWDNEDDDTSPTQVGALYFHANERYDFGIGSPTPAQHSSIDKDALLEGFDPFTTDKEMTMVFTWLYPSVHEGDGRSNIGMAGDSQYNANYQVRRSKDENGDSINVRYHLRLQQASGSSNYLHIRNDFNSLANDDQAMTQIFTENPIVPDKKFVLFARVNRKKGTISLALNKDNPTSTAIADNDVSYTRNSNAINNDGNVSNVNLWASKTDVPELRNYDFRIYEKDLTYEEQLAVWDELSEIYKVEE